MTQLPSQSRAGCLGKGCLILVALTVLLSGAFVAGGFWAVKRFQQTYSAAEPYSFQEYTTGWESVPPEQQPASSPVGARRTQPSAPDPQVDDVQRRWDAFERAANRGRTARIEMTDRELNMLLNNTPKLRGKAAVQIVNDIGRVRLSIPMSDIIRGEGGGWATSVLGINGRYLNGEVTVIPSPSGDPSQARITDVRIGDRRVPDEFLDQRLFGMSSVRMLITDWLADENIRRFQIEDGRVIAETAPSR